MYQDKLVPVCQLDRAPGGLAAFLQAGTHPDLWHMVQALSLLAYLSPADLFCSNGSDCTRSSSINIKKACGGLTHKT